MKTQSWIFNRFGGSGPRLASYFDGGPLGTLSRLTRYQLPKEGYCLPAPTALQWRMAISTNREKTLEECKRHIDECAALLEKTSVPEYREAIIAMGKAWMKIAEQAKQVGD